MKRVFGLSRLGLAGAALVAAFLMMEGEAMAVTLNVCVPEKEGTAIVTPKVGVCEAKYNPSVLLPRAEAEKLEKILPYIKYEEKGVDGKSTIKFSGVNVQIVNGEGKTATVNGEGNLVIGYNEGPEATEKTETTEKTGSHNLILGNYQTYTSYGGILSGSDNTISGPFASITGGYKNTVSVSGDYSSVSGGYKNTASSNDSSVTGGFDNTASYDDSSVSGGDDNTASGYLSSVSGGEDNTASGDASSVSGGYKNTASGSDSSVSGGESNTPKGERAWVGGGYKNLAEGELSAIFGGKELKTVEKYEAIG
jgi:hypothetical protein